MRLGSEIDVDCDDDVKKCDCYDVFCPYLGRLDDDNGLHRADGRIEKMVVCENDAVILHHLLDGLHRECF